MIGSKRPAHALVLGRPVPTFRPLPLADELPAIPATLVACDFHRLIQDADRRIGGDERKRTANGPRRNGVVVEIGPDVNGLS